MNLAILPVLLPLLTGLIAMLWGGSTRFRRAFVAVSAASQLAVAFLLIGDTHADHLVILGVGAWFPGIGIVLVIDLLSAIMVSLSSLVALASLLFGYAETGVHREHPLRLPLLQFLMMGVNLTFCTGDLFNLFVAFEIMLISSYALLTLEADDWDIRQAYPYIAVNMIGSALFISACGLAYGLLGTLNFAEIALRAQAMSGDPRLEALGLLLLVVFGIKAGLFPLYYWLPNSYPILPLPLAAFYSGILTKVGVYVLLRVFGTVLPHDLHFAHQLLAWLAGLTMILAVMGAISRNFIRGILSFHILSQIGFMVLAIGLFTPLSFTAAIYYITHHIIVKSSLFLICGTAMCLNRTDDLDRMGNLWSRTPWLGVLFLCQALSLAGLPPLSGFWGKYLIVVVGIELGEYPLVIVAILASILTLVSMLKIWNAAFWSETPATVRVYDPRWRRMTTVVAGLTVLSLAIGLVAEPFLRVAGLAAERVLDQTQYVNDVLQHRGKGAALANP